MLSAANADLWENIRTNERVHGRDARAERVGERYLEAVGIPGEETWGVGVRHIEILCNDDGVCNVDACRWVMDCREAVVITPIP